MTFEQEPSLAIVLLNDRLTRLEHEEESAVGRHERHPAVQRDVQVAIVLVTGLSQMTDGSDDAAVERVFRHERTCFRL